MRTSNRPKTSWVRFAAATAVAAFSASGAAAAEKRPLPNIVVILCDDLGYGDLACYGHPSIATPCLDRLAAEGQKWTSFYAAASVCTPSRAALLTGRLPIRSGMMAARNRVLFPDSAGGLPAAEQTLAEQLRAVGYATAAIGKWHLGHLPEFLPTRHGFDSFWGIPYSNDMDLLPGSPDYRQLAAGDSDGAADSARYDVPILEGERVVERPADQSTLTRRCTERALDFIDRSRDQPFFLYLAPSMPHVPLFAGEPFRDASRRGRYGDVVEEIDAGVGRIADRLRKHGIAGRTLVVFTSDNGPWLSYATHGGSAGLLRDGKGTTYEGGMRVPAIFWQPGTVAPGVQRDVGSTLDLLPTCTAWAGAALPEGLQLDGCNLAPVLRGESTVSPRQEMFFWREAELHAVRSGPWKAHFIAAGGSGSAAERTALAVPELYHLERDPAERFDVASRHPDVVARLAALAAAHRAGVVPVENQLEKRIPPPLRGSRR